MKLYLEFNESEAKHLKTLESGQGFSSNQGELFLKVQSEGEILTVRVGMIDDFMDRRGINLGCEIPKGAIKAGEKLLLFRN